MPRPLSSIAPLIRRVTCTALFAGFDRRQQHQGSVPYADRDGVQLYREAFAVAERPCVADCHPAAALRQSGALTDKDRLTIFLRSLPHLSLIYHVYLHWLLPQYSIIDCGSTERRYPHTRLCRLQRTEKQHFDRSRDRHARARAEEARRPAPRPLSHPPRHQRSRIRRHPLERSVLLFRRMRRRRHDQAGGGGQRLRPETRSASHC